jgi:hypothetical protein
LSREDGAFIRVTDKELAELAPVWKTGYDFFEAQELAEMIGKRPG